jgi:hypothetical protein
MHCSYLGASVPWTDCVYPVPGLFLPSQQILHECFKIWDGWNLSRHTAQLQWVTTINDPFCSPPDRLPPVENEVCVYVSCSYRMSTDSINALFWADLAADSAADSAVDSDSVAGAEPAARPAIRKLVQSSADEIELVCLCL